ncbi:hypothetical protein ACLKA7_014981 [Drosophila subpalustris]
MCNEHEPYTMHEPWRGEARATRQPKQRHDEEDVGTRGTTTNRCRQQTTAFVTNNSGLVLTIFGQVQISANNDELTTRRLQPDQ